MQYLLLLHANEAGFSNMTPEQQQQGFQAYMAYGEALSKAGALKGSNRLLDGPYADSKEQLGGYYLIDAPDLDAALDWAARCPGASHGAIEVRPIWEMGDY